jgi:hypothetical protein
VFYYWEKSYYFKAQEGRATSLFFVWLEVGLDYNGFRDNADIFLQIR